MQRKGSHLLNSIQPIELELAYSYEFDVQPREGHDVRMTLTKGDQVIVVDVPTFAAVHLADMLKDAADRSDKGNYD